MYRTSKNGPAANRTLSFHFVYVYPEHTEGDGRPWLIAIRTESSGKMHNHMIPSEWKISPKVLSYISNVVSKNTTLAPKDLQKGLQANGSISSCIKH